MPDLNHRRVRVCLMRILTSLRIARIQRMETGRDGKSDLVGGQKIMRHRVQLQLERNRMAWLEGLQSPQANRSVAQVKVAASERKAIREQDVEIGIGRIGPHGQG